jgi:hypothetical protein
MIPVINNEQLLHTIRFPTTWQPWGDVRAAVKGLRGSVRAVAAAEIAGDVHYLIATDTDLFHTIRFASPARWQPSGDVFNVLGRPSTSHIDRLAAATVAGDLHVVVLFDDQQLLHTIRFTSPPGWQPWGDIKAAVGNPGGFSLNNVAAAGIGGDLHLVVISSPTDPDSMDVFHTIRFPSSWQPWGNVESTTAGPLPGLVWDLAAAAVSGDLHLLVTNGPSLFHTIRFTSPARWQPWGNVEAAAGELGSFRRLAAADGGGDLHLVAAVGPAVTETHLFHTIRFTSPGRWQPWGDIEAAIGDPGNVRDFAVA